MIYFCVVGIIAQQKCQILH